MAAGKETAGVRGVLKAASSVLPSDGGSKLDKKDRNQDVGLPFYIHIHAHAHVHTLYTYKYIYIIHIYHIHHIHTHAHTHT